MEIWHTFKCTFYRVYTLIFFLKQKQMLDNAHRANNMLSDDSSDFWVKTFIYWGGKKKLSM